MEKRTKRRRLSPEEIKVRNRKKNRKFRKYKLSLVLLFLSVVMSFLLYRIWDVQFVEGKELEYRKLATMQQASRFDKVIMANRGMISDRNGEVLAISNTVYDIILDITNIFEVSSVEKRKLAIENNINVLSEVLGVEKEEISRYYEIDPTTKQPKYIDYMYLKIASKIPYDDYKRIENANLTSVYGIENTQRSYPKDNLASQIVGFMRGDHSYNYYGLENYYNSYLLGTNGRKYSTFNENGENYIHMVEPINGNRIQTTLDLNLQRFAEDVVFEYAEEYDAENAAIIVMKAKTSEILVMAQYPTYNSNFPGEYGYFNDTNFVEEYESLEDGNESFEKLMSVWNNFSISDTFEPGSTYKPSVVAAAIEEKVISNDDVFFCSGSINVLDRNIGCWNKNGHGSQNVLEVLSNSCNVGMIEIAEKMGPEMFLKYQENFGFGQLTGVDLTGEVSSKNLMFDINNLRQVELATSSMGQGFNSTALQSINAFASVINGGNLMKPYIVSEVVSNDEKVVFRNEPTLLRKTISTETSDFLRIGMQNVVDSGTGKNAQIPGYSIGGKTGTAEQGNREEENETVSFIGYFPVENPEYIVMSVLHLPEVDVSGGGQAAPMVKEVMNKIIEYYSIPPTKVIENPTSPINSNQVITPNLIGQDVDVAVNQLINMGIDFQVLDSGQFVVKTFPNAGKILSRDGKILIYSGEPVDIQKKNKDDETLIEQADIELAEDQQNNDNEESNEDDSNVSVDVATYLNTKELVSVPDLSSLTLNSAIDSLEFFDFNYTVIVNENGKERDLESDGSEIQLEDGTIKIVDYNNYTVIRQSHKADISTPKGSTVVIIVE